MKRLALLLLIACAHHAAPIQRAGYELVFLNDDPKLDPTVRARMIDAFFTVYPLEVAAYNPSAPRRVTFHVDPSYDGVAATDAGVVRFNPAWFHQHPDDIDVVTHEVMHIVQAYPPDVGPGWVTEGIADYVRDRFGVANAAAGWRLPEVTAAHHYTTSYRVTARFLVWLEARHPGLVKTLDAAMRSSTYSAELWPRETGHTVDELWAAYVADPAITAAAAAPPSRP